MWAYMVQPNVPFGFADLTDSYPNVADAREPCGFLRGEVIDDSLLCKIFGFRCLFEACEVSPKFSNYTEHLHCSGSG